MKAYALKDPKGKIIAWSCNEVETSSKVEIVNAKGYEFTFQELEKKGYRCVPVTITEVKTDK